NGARAAGEEEGACGLHGLRKVVLARRSECLVQCTGLEAQPGASPDGGAEEGPPGGLDPLALLGSLQGRNPAAYQFCIQVADETAFVGSTPERLFSRCGDWVASEAVAGTRARGPASDHQADAEIAYEMLLNPKEHDEFTIVRESVRAALLDVCEGPVQLEMEKAILKQATVQHLYSQMSGRLRGGATEADLLSALHPTPAVCGQPRHRAQGIIAEDELFDRGFYAGPVGWLTACSSEFAVAIRSALVQPRASPAAVLAHAPPASEDLAAAWAHIFLYAGVGVVPGASPEKEWAELNLKTGPFRGLLAPPPSLRDMPNLPAAWACALVEELTRLGVTYFCIAPGSRSSPLATAVAANPRARALPCLDERSLAFHAVGYARGAQQPAAVITSSGTAVYNLAPAVVEASQAGVPLLLLTADRPPELRDTGANQAVDQVKAFEGHTRWHFDVPAPSQATTLRFLLSTVDTAVAHARGDHGQPAGPVHLNLQFREPLAPVPQPWDAEALLAGLGEWEVEGGAFTRYLRGGLGSGGDAAEAGAGQLAGLMRRSERGLLVAGELGGAGEALAVAMLSQQLGWPVVADPLSGLRVRGVESGPRGPHVVPFMDQVLVVEGAGRELQPDVILQIGVRVTSKRVMAFLDEASEAGTPWALVHAGAGARHDPSHRVTHTVRAPPLAFAEAVLRALCPEGALEHAPEDAGPDARGRQQGLTEYGARLLIASCAVSRALDGALMRLVEDGEMAEPHVARAVASGLPIGHGLFVGNSMPIRDLDFFGGTYTSRPVKGGAAASSHYRAPPLDTPEAAAAAWMVGAPVAANRGASGIDGVLSTAIGYAAGLQRPVTLMVGDVSFAHDSNGLLMLRESNGLPALAVVVINNGGGGIFSFLPVAGLIPQDTFEPLFATPPGMDLELLCAAHRLPHIRVENPASWRMGGSLKGATEGCVLQPALEMAWSVGRHCVVEVMTNRTANTLHHRTLAAASAAAVATSLHITGLLPLPHLPCDGGMAITTAAYQSYRLPLRQASTTGVVDERRGWLLRLEAEGGCEAYGEEEAEMQLVLVCRRLEGVKLPVEAALLGGALRQWLHEVLGFAPGVLVPSVACGLEVALMELIAASRGTSLLHLLLGRTPPRLPDAAIFQARPQGEAPVAAARINALLAGRGTIEEVALEAARLVTEEGYRALKIKVGRKNRDPEQDAALVQAVREAVGSETALRCDANRAWTLAQAQSFGGLVKGCDLEYLEEPLQRVEELEELHRTTGIPVALDETVDEAMAGIGQSLSLLSNLRPEQGVVALVLKPGAIGGVENTTMLTQWAQQRNPPLRVIISAAFESPVYRPERRRMTHYRSSGVSPPMRRAHDIIVHQVYRP
ncbi:hypothetical protein CYMTET_13591, partial [Cymbomonas tetramitiformis]